MALRRVLTGLLASVVLLSLANGCGEQELPAGVAAQVDGAVIGTGAVGRYAARERLGRGQALIALVEAQWLAREARRRGLSVPARAATTSTELRRLRTLLVRRQRPSAAQVAAYYRAHRTRFGPPRRRDAWFVRVDRLAAASEVRGGLARGASWEQSIDAARRWDPQARGAALPFVEHRFTDERFGAALFAARIGRIAGPLRTPRGWYVYQAFREDPGPRRPPARVRPAVVAAARADLLQRRLRDRYAGVTRCAARYRELAQPVCPG